MKFTFVGRIANEGSKGNLVLNIPARAHWPAPRWTKIALDGGPPCVVFCRKRYRCTAGLVSLPIWHFGSFQFRQEVQTEISTVDELPSVEPGEKPLDWLAFVNRDEVFPTNNGNSLRLWSRYSKPFDLLRFPPTDAVYRMLGLYQAEGSKSTNGHDFMFANANAFLLQNLILLLDTIGIPRSELYLEVLHAHEESPDKARVKYEPLGVEITAVRLRTGKGNNAGVLHIHNSLPFKHMICKALDWIFMSGFPNREAALAYVLGWLDGDGTITQTGSGTELRLAGLEMEHTTLKRALAQALQWNFEQKRASYQNNKNGTHITLKTNEMVDLLDHNAFPFSMSRIRLLLGLSRRMERFMNGSARGAFQRWGWRSRNNADTEQGSRLKEAFERYRIQIEMAKQLQATSPFLFGVKSEPLPTAFQPENLKDLKL